jgi:hypothetical protein
VGFTNQENERKKKTITKKTEFEAKETKTKITKTQSQN